MVFGIFSEVRKNYCLNNFYLNKIYYSIVLFEWYLTNATNDVILAEIIIKLIHIGNNSEVSSVEHHLERTPRNILGLPRDDNNVKFLCALVESRWSMFVLISGRYH